MATDNHFLHKARDNKKDEFYTQFCDIEKEMTHYVKHFAEKTVYCNCDNPKESMFWRYFHDNFEKLGLKSLVSTYYSASGSVCKWEYHGCNHICSIVPLSGNGDFRSEECQSILADCDIVVTNPPFSLFKEYIDLLMSYHKKFLIIGNMNALNYKNVFPLIRDNQVWYGTTIHSGDREFRVPQDYPLTAAGVRIDDVGNKYVRVKGVRWFTNLDYDKRHQPLELSCTYSPEKYPKYDNYDAININKYKEIPKDYDGVMGVPITIVDFFCPEQFEMLGMSASWDESDAMKEIKTSDTKRHGPILDGREIYRRIFIRRRR